MTIDPDRLKAAAVRLWQQNQLTADVGRQYLQRKVRLMGGGEIEVSNVLRYVELLDEAHSLLSALAPEGQITEFAKEELTEFCELAGLLPEDVSQVLQRFAVGTTETQNEPATSFGGGQIAVVAASVTGDDTPSDSASNYQATPLTKHAIWVPFIREACGKVAWLSRCLSDAASGEALIALNLPAKIEHHLQEVENLVSAELVSRGHLTNEAVRFSVVRDPFLARVTKMHAALKSVVLEKRALTSDFAESLRGGSRFVGTGSVGMIAAAGVLNVTGGLFSGVSRWNQKRSYEGELNQRVMAVFADGLNDILNDFADVISAYWDVLQLVGAASNDEMLRRMQDAHYVVGKASHISDLNARLEALENARQTYPFMDVDWLESVVELAPSLGSAVRPVLDAVESTYVGHSGDLRLARVLVQLQVAPDADVREEARQLAAPGEFSLPVRNGPWPIGTKEVDLALRVRLAMGIVGADLDAMLPVEQEACDSLLQLLQHEVSKADIVQLVLQFLISLQNADWPEAARKVGSIRELVPRAAQAHHTLEGLWLAAVLHGVSHGKVESPTVLFRRIGLESKAGNSLRSADGGDLFCLAMWDAVLGGRRELATRLARATPTTFKASVLPLRLDWFGPVDSADRPQGVVCPSLAQRLVRENKIPSGPLPQGLLRLLFAAYRIDKLRDVWEDLVVELVNNLETHNTEGAAILLAEVASDCKGVIAAQFLGMSLQLRGLDLERDADTLRSMLEAGATRVNLTDVVDDPAVLDAIDQLRKKLANTAKQWMHQRILELHEAAPNLVELEDPGSHRLNGAQRKALCEQFGPLDGTLAPYLAPDHLIGAWFDSKSCILLSAYGVLSQARGSDTIHFTPYEAIKVASNSGWINDYLKLEMVGDSIEIPCQLDSENRPAHELLIYVVNSMADVAKASYAQERDEAWSVLTTKDWSRLAGEIEARSRYVVIFWLDDEVLARTLHEAKAVSDPPSTVRTAADLAADFSDDQFAESVKTVQQMAKALPVGRSTTLYLCGSLEARKVKEFLGRVRDKLPTITLRESDILAFYDETLTGVGDRGVAVTPTHLIWTVEGQGAYQWADIDDITVSGLLNRKIIVKLADKSKHAMVVTQGNKEAELIVQLAKQVKLKMDELPVK